MGKQSLRVGVYFRVRKDPSKRPNSPRLGYARIQSSTPPKAPLVMKWKAQSLIVRTRIQPVALGRLEACWQRLVPMRGSLDVFAMNMTVITTWAVLKIMAPFWF